MIEIKFTGDSLEEVKALAAEFAGSEEAAPAKTTRSRAKKAPADDEEKKPVKKAKGVTADDIREAMSAKTEEDEDNTPLLKKILKRFEATKISELEESDYAAVLEAINDL